MPVRGAVSVLNGTNDNYLPGGQCLDKASFNQQADP